MYYSGLAQGRRRNRKEMGGGCTSKPGLCFPNLSPRFHLAVVKLQARVVLRVRGSCLCLQGEKGIS